MEIMDRHWSEAWFRLDRDPRIAMTSQLAVIHHNDAADPLFAEGLVTKGAGLRIRFMQPGANRIFTEKARKLLSGKPEAPRFVIALNDESWAVIHLLLFRDAADPLLLMTMRVIGLRDDLNVEAVSAAFGLSVSELPILKGLTAAHCPKEIAAQLNLSVNTVRSHIRSIYLKLGVRTQTEAQRISLAMSI